MAQPIERTLSPRSIEVPLTAARVRIRQLFRMVSGTGQFAVVVDGGRKAVLVPFDIAFPSQKAADVQDERPRTAAGWAQRIEAVSQTLRAQHAADRAGLLTALDQAWKVIDGVRPPGTDRTVDQLRALHAEFLRMMDQ